jgi:hypothetical protein
VTALEALLLFATLLSQKQVSGEVHGSGGAHPQFVKSRFRRSAFGDRPQLTTSIILRHLVEIVRWAKPFATNDVHNNGADSYHRRGSRGQHK